MEPDGGKLYRSLGELGDLSPVFRHLHHCWSRGIGSHCEWLIGWFADIVRDPADKKGVMVRLQNE